MIKTEKIKMNHHSEFLKLLKPQWRIIAGAALIIFFLSLSNFPIPLGMMYFINQVNAGETVNYQLEIILGIIAVVLIGYLLKILINYLTNAFKERVFLKIQSNLFYHLHDLPLAFFNTTETRFLMSRIRNDIYTAGEILADQLVSGLTCALTFFIAIIFCLWINVVLTIASLLTLPFWVLTLLLPQKRIIHMKNETDQRNADVLRNLDESLKNIYITKLYNRERWRFVKLFSVLRDEIMARIRFGIYNCSMGNLPEMIAGLGTIVILGLGIHLTVSGHISLGGAIAFISFYQFLFHSLGKLVNLNGEFHHSLAALNRIYTMLKLPKEEPVVIAPLPDEVQNNHDTEGELTFSHVYFSYQRHAINLLDVSFSMKRGEVLVVTGKNNAGKSSIVHLLARFYQPRKGKIFLDGQNINEIPLPLLRKRIGILPQEPILFNGTIKENITLGKKTYSKEQIFDAAKIAMAHNFISGFPLGYNTEVGAGGINLSKGEKQRIAIARAILRHPDILVVDEGTSDIDVMTEKRILHALAHSYQDGYLILVTHRIFSIPMACKIVLLENGHMVDMESPVEFHYNQTYQEPYHRQQYKF